MINNFKLVTIDSDYCDYLRTYDNRVSYNFERKSLRPFIGVLFNIDKYEYYAPLSSPKDKHKFMHDTLDFLRINNGLYGVINFNNMIPVMKKNYKIVDFNNNIFDEKRILLMISQLKWLNNNKDKIITKSYLLYKLYTTNKLPYNVKKRCCNFILLEQKCEEYNKELIH